jgi:hypothetical protein
MRGWAMHGIARLCDAQQGAAVPGEVVGGWVWNLVLK